MTRVITPHPERVRPACAIADRCGGCDWMHASRAWQRTEAERRWRDALGDHWHRALELHDVGPEHGYRCRARLAIAAGGAIRVGYRRARSHEVVPAEACEILHPELERLLPELRTWLGHSQGEGEAAIALGAGGMPVMDLRFSGDLDATLFGRLDRSVGERRCAGARVWDGDVSTPATFGDPRPWVRGADGVPLVIAAGGFSQPSLEGGAALANHVAAAISAPGPDATVVELFAGSGTLTVALRAGPLRDVPNYLVVEAFEARSALEENLARRHLPPVRFEAADANETVLPRGVDLVVLDPPRRGAPGAMSTIRAAKVARLLYVSCNPASLARDLRILGPEYRVVAAAAFRLFPQTHHVETVLRLERT
ncbi:MAG: class I SAM-dependent RNA methyltransferase [Myxococcota bacterium]